MQLTNREIRRHYSALTRLAGKTLPSIKSDLKVAALIRRYFGPAYQVTEDALSKALQGIPVPDWWHEPGIPETVAEQRTKAANEIAEGVQDLGEIPERLLLTEEDMPKERTGLADIIACLDRLYWLED
jgi:hypothetical protein